MFFFHLPAMRHRLRYAASTFRRHSIRLDAVAGRAGIRLARLRPPRPCRVPADLVHLGGGLLVGAPSRPAGVELVRLQKGRRGGELIPVFRRKTTTTAIECWLRCSLFAPGSVAKTANSRLPGAQSSMIPRPPPRTPRPERVFVLFVRFRVVRARVGGQGVARVRHHLPRRGRGRGRRGGRDTPGRAKPRRD